MQETDGHIKAIESSGAFGAPRMPTRPITWSMTAKAKPHEPSEFKSVLLAIAGHDLRQPLQVIQNAHEFPGRGVRTTSELPMLRFAQIAIDRLRDQLDELVAALPLRGNAKVAKLTPVRVGPLLQQATRENAVAALTKGFSVRTVPTSATIESDALLLCVILRNLVGNAIIYTQPGDGILPSVAFQFAQIWLRCMKTFSCRWLELVATEKAAPSERGYGASEEWKFSAAAST